MDSCSGQRTPAERVRAPCAGCRVVGASGARMSLAIVWDRSACIPMAVTMKKSALVFNDAGRREDLGSPFGPRSLRGDARGAIGGSDTRRSGPCFLHET